MNQKLPGRFDASKWLGSALCFFDVSVGFCAHAYVYVYSLITM